MIPQVQMDPRRRNIFMRKVNLITTSILALILLQVGAMAQNRYADRQARVLLNRIESRTDTFKREVQLALDRSPLNSTNREDRITEFISDFESSTDSLRSGYAANRNVTSEINDVLNRATFINRFMTRNRLNARAQNEWSGLRTDLNSLARLYAVTWDWNRMPDYGPVTGGGFGTGPGRG